MHTKIRLKIILISLLLFVLLFNLPVSAGQMSDVNVWIYFKDKATDSNSRLYKPNELLTERAVQRRLKVLNHEELVSEKDLPVSEKYIEVILPLINKIRLKSRWLNAVSVEIAEENINKIEALNFVDKVTPVLAYKKEIPGENLVIDSEYDYLRKKNIELDYGNSLTQLELIKVPAMHEKGFYGQGVLICMLDDGFNLLNIHEAFDSLDVIATWDFINADESVDDSGLIGSEGWHGTKTLSCIGGYVPGKLIGPAFKASYLLAKTEVDDGETKIEEDYWVAGIEWAENQGADIASSSLGYIDWYTQDDMDGKTAVTTIAADIAVELGMVVVCSAGNEGYSVNQNTLIAPADGDNVIAVGAVSSNGLRSSFSSIGPSADGRIKPDVAAMGTGVYVASSSDSMGYTLSNGTSFSCPLTSGAIALLLNAYPQLTPEQIYDAVISTASQSTYPDNLLGYGIINIEAAYNYIDTSRLVEIDQEPYPEFIKLSQNYPNPFNSQTTIEYSLKQSAEVEIYIYDFLGRKIESFNTGIKRGKRFYSFTYDFSSYASGVYFFQVRAKKYSTADVSIKSKKLIFIK
ncbi:MAG: S8 family serine peptidase [Calditrichaceae bacterium]|nr:S8 family serine peptidase [Calditrichaceae bacterium]